MVIYDWRRCPAQVTPPPGPADYGPLAADIGTRDFGAWDPMPNVEIDSCPETQAGGVGAAVIGAGLAWLMLRKKG